MSKLKEVNVFALGDSEKISTWSNVPYFFVHSLMAKGIRVNRVNINRSFVGKVLNRMVWRPIGRLNGDTTYDYFRSSFHFANVRRKIVRALNFFNRADANIFLTFSFSSAGLTPKPTILFCDWTYDHHIKYFANKVPDRLELASIQREDQQIENAHLVFVLFPRVAEYMKGRYKNKNIFYLGNVVNSNLNAPEADVLAAKDNSDEILFIGGSKYHAGAVSLIQAYELLSATMPRLRLNIVGIKTQDFDELPFGVTCYGYLDKARQRDRETYYALLSRAKVLVNTTPKWGAFSATLEAMHFYTPVITSPYDDFVETFGRTIDFGLYCESTSAAELGSRITDVFDHPAYRQLCLNAHAAVQDYTWDTYIEKIVGKIEAILPMQSKLVEQAGR